MALLIVVVNYRSAAWTELCLTALAPEMVRLGPDAEAIVVDNASGDGSPERLDAFRRVHFPAAPIRIVEAAQNGGFSYGNNVAIEMWFAERPQDAAGVANDAVLLLNPDTQVRPGSLVELTGFLAGHPNVGIAGARLEHADGRPQAASFNDLGFATEFQQVVQFGPLGRWFGSTVAAPSDQPVRTGWVSGACMLVRRAVFDAVGPMDEGYFLYFEELDFIRRARSAGFECWHVPQSCVVHHVGKTTGVTAVEDASQRRPAYWYASRQRYFGRHVGIVASMLLDTLVVVGDGLGGVLAALRRRPRARPARFLRDFVRHALTRHHALVAPSRRAGPRLKPREKVGTA